MAEVDGNLVVEILRSIQRDISEVKLGIGELKAELGAMRGHLISTHQDIHNIYAVLGRHDMRFERIEKRLEIHEAPALS